MLKTTVECPLAKGSFTLNSWGILISFFNKINQIKMKRVLVAAMLLLVTISVFATEGEIDRGKVRVVQAVQGKRKMDKSCTVSIKGVVGVLPFAGSEFNCSATAETCSEALDDAEKCVEEGIRRGRKKLIDFMSSLKFLWPL